MVTEQDIEAAFRCQPPTKSEGMPHDWDYLKNKYRCRNCLVVITKDRLKELTDA